VLQREYHVRIVITDLAVGLLVGGSARGADPTDEFFNGKDLTGWEGKEKLWKVQDGAIVGGGAEKNPYNTFLCSKKKYRDFELKFEVRMTGPGIKLPPNSGLGFRTEVTDRVRFIAKGPQIEIGAGNWGAIYYAGSTKSRPRKTPRVPIEIKESDFNDFTIRCIGQRVTVHLNGQLRSDADCPEMPDEGIIAWQLKAFGEPAEITLRNIEFRELN
jgi:hypothetical protein